MPVNGPELRRDPELLLAEGNLSRGISPNPQGTSLISLIICLDEVVVVFREYFSTEAEVFFLVNICKEVTVTSKCPLSSLLQ